MKPNRPILDQKEAKKLQYEALLCGSIYCLVSV